MLFPRQTVFNGVIVSADSYFTNLNGVYVYDQFKISDAHQSCKTRGNNFIIIYKKVRKRGKKHFRNLEGKKIELNF